MGGGGGGGGVLVVWVESWGCECELVIVKIPKKCRGPVGRGEVDWEDVNQELKLL